MSAVIEVRGLCKSFGGVVANHDLSLGVAAGTITGLIGPNGAGKSTVLNSMFGFTRIAGGRVDVGGHDVVRLSPGARLTQARIGYVMVSGQVVMAGTGDDLLASDEVARQFLGGGDHAGRG